MLGQHCSSPGERGALGWRCAAGSGAELGYPETRSLLTEFSASWDHMRLVQFPTAPKILQFIHLPRTEERKGVLLCPVLHTDRIKARVWLAPSLETVVVHTSSARMTHGALHSASWLCTEQRCCIWKAQAVAAQHLTDAACQAFTANDIYCRTNENWPPQFCDQRPTSEKDQQTYFQK